MKRFIIILLKFSFLMLSANLSYSQSDYPSWIPEEVKYAVRKIWIDNISERSDEDVVDSFGLVGKLAAQGCDFKYPYRWAKIDCENYMPGDSIDKYLLVSTIYGFSIYYFDSFVGTIEIFYGMDRWQYHCIAYSGRLMTADEDRTRQVYEIYPSSKDYMIFGAPPTFYIINDNKIIDLMVYDTELRKYTSRDPIGYINKECIRIKKAWKDVPKEILNRKPPPDAVIPEFIPWNDERKKE